MVEEPGFAQKKVLFPKKQQKKQFSKKHLLILTRMSFCWPFGYRSPMDPCVQSPIRGGLYRGGYTCHVETINICIYVVISPILEQK